MPTDTKKPSPLERIRNRPPNVDHFTFALDPNDAIEIEAARSALAEAIDEAARRPQSKAAQAAKSKAKKKLDQLVDACVTCTLTLQSIGPAACEELQHAHPATDEQIEAMPDDADTSTAVNMATYAPALISASLVSFVISDDPDTVVTEMTPDEAAELWGGLQEMDQIMIIGMTRMLNGRSSQVDASGKG